MQYKPMDYPTMSKAHIFVGCDTESATKVYFSKEALLEEIADHAYIAFFDKDGSKIDEVKVVDWQEGHEELMLEDSF